MLSILSWHEQPVFVIFNWMQHRQIPNLPFTAVNKMHNGLSSYRTCVEILKDNSQTVFVWYDSKNKQLRWKRECEEEKKTANPIACTVSDDSRELEEI